MNILLAVTGSISAYKALDITRSLVKNGHRVKVICSKGAEQFVVPQCFRYLGALNVYSYDDDFRYPQKEEDAPVLHVDLAKWCHKFVIAPLSANTASRLARGEASDLLSSVFLALPPEKEIIIFPAMNTHMLNHPFVQENLQGLKKLQTLDKVYIHPTAKGLLACQEVGEGKLAPVEEIIQIIDCYKTTSSDMKKVLITTGATISPLDTVRFLTNSSSGITGLHLAKEALQRGYQVKVLAGKYATDKLDLLKNLPNFSIERVVTTEDMFERVKELVPKYNIYISSAAIGDIQFKMKKQKIKKDSLDDSLEIEKATDILSYVVSLKNKNLKTVGFAAESEISNEVLIKKFSKKPVDLLVGTKVNNGLIKGEEQKGFINDKADYAFIESETNIIRAELSKEMLASRIFNQVTQ